MRIGQKIALYRKRSKLSAEELAAKVGRGLTRSILANLETGRKQDLTVSQLLGVAVVLGVRPIDLIFDLSEPNERISSRMARGLSQRPLGWLLNGSLPDSPLLNWMPRLTVNQWN